MPRGAGSAKHGYRIIPSLWQVQLDRDALGVSGDINPRSNEIIKKQQFNKMFTVSTFCLSFLAKLYATVVKRRWANLSIWI